MRAIIVGWIRREDFVEICRVMNFGYGPRVGVDQEELASVDVRYVVDDDEVGTLAQERDGHKRFQRVKDQRFASDLTSLDVNKYGICAEIAVGRWLGVEPDLSLYHGPDPGFDMVSKRGATVDAKATKHPEGRLFFNNIEKFKADVAVLVIVRD